MTEIDRIVALERELEDTRRAAVEIVLGMVDCVARTAAQREELALGFARATTGTDPLTARLAWVMVEAIRRDGRHSPDLLRAGSRRDG